MIAGCSIIAQGTHIFLAILTYSIIVMHDLLARDLLSFMIFGDFSHVTIAWLGSLKFIYFSIIVLDEKRKMQ